MNRNLFQTAGKLFFDQTHNRHAVPLADCQNSVLVYAVKPLNDKGFTPSWAQETFCYTWHALKGLKARVSPKKGPG